MATEKISMPRGLNDIPTGAGPDQIADAVMRFNQLRTLVRPTDETLRTHGLSRGAFQDSLRRITSRSQGKDKLDLRKAAPDPRMYAGLAGLAGLAGVGGLGYMAGLQPALAALPIATAGAGAAYVHAANKREGIKRTAQLMKQYGLLNPQTLRQAYPLLGDDYKVAHVSQVSPARAFGEKCADQHGGMFGPAGYVNTLSRWYNPMTKQRVTDPTEKTMMRVGQGALGAAGAAGAGLAATAASPTMAFSVTTGVPAAYGMQRQYMNTVNSLKRMAGQK